ncbi:ion transporter [soil metagenome]
MQLQERVYQVLEADDRGGALSNAVDAFLLSLIALNVVALVLETVEPLYLRAPWLFHGFEVFSVAIFSVEYVVRIWSVTARPRYARAVRGRLRWAVTPLALGDLLAVLPFYLPFLGVDLRFFRTLRLFRLFRVAKLWRYSAALHTVGRVVRRKREELLMVVLILGLLLLFASSLMYFVERDVQPEHFGSIPTAMWWGISTLTTVGYGDVYPVTALGRVLAGVIQVVGIGMFALPTGLLGAAFVEENEKEPSRRCPHCGREVTE